MTLDLIEKIQDIHPPCQDDSTLPASLFSKITLMRNLSCQLTAEGKYAALTISLESSMEGEAGKSDAADLGETIQGFDVFPVPWIATTAGGGIYKGSVNRPQ
uniref:Uncharacterized protein n=1 Tax=Candidatus Kentrum sp. TUN TaxID=2126343 RepID=A0A450ZBF4_9GAMM|nr:MAG: hypothetical protein BECKTUN1418E_GA0071001_100512 [Candidatus Kentron sp. TUN]VFK51331.1 MAG: hypothetical protein BECKTUN1418D_GA0071000_100711 [Candidatus Kentron sp. TUN]VFK59350.1 MAG: hypothetical protein BECKTUN1418F_GA0071002_11722 [Candidatus Kentron sp. TUN]